MAETLPDIAAMRVISQKVDACVVETPALDHGWTEARRLRRSGGTAPRGSCAERNQLAGRLG